MLAALGADCRSPVAALATRVGKRLWLRAEILSEDGRECEAGEMWLDAAADAVHLAHELLGRAGPALKVLFTG